MAILAISRNLRANIFEHPCIGTWSGCSRHLRWSGISWSWLSGRTLSEMLPLRRLENVFRWGGVLWRWISQRSLRHDSIRKKNWFEFWFKIPFQKFKIYLCRHARHYKWNLRLFKPKLEYNFFQLNWFPGGRGRRTTSSPAEWHFATTSKKALSSLLNPMRSFS